MIGSVAGLTLHDGYNPFKSGELAKELAQAVDKLALAKSENEWNKAVTTFHATEERVAQALHNDRPEFVRRAQQAGLNYTEADTVFRRLEESVAEARRRGREIRCWFTQSHRKRIMASVGYRATDDLVPGEDGWALSWQYNGPHVEVAIDAVLQAINELDRVAHFTMGPPPRMRFDDATRTIYLDGKEVARHQDHDVLAYFKLLWAAYPNDTTFKVMKEKSNGELTNDSRTKKKMPASLKKLFTSTARAGSRLKLPPPPAR